jgi:hypothetical protein
MVLSLAAAAAYGGTPTLSECAEASEFIANAARARDAGLAREAFLSRMRDDFIVIRAFPPALRWFARDDDDERFLLAAAADVWNRPRPPDEHRAAVLGECVARAAA